MTVQEFYEAVGGGYEEVMSRMMKEERVIKYLRRFPEDQSYNELMANLEKNDDREAFRAVHTLKGVALNLGLEKLGEVSSVLCEELRPGPPQIDISQMVEDVRAEYAKVIDGIGSIEG